MALDTLPPELVLNLARFLPEHSLNTMIRTQKRFAKLLTPCLYRKIVTECELFDTGSEHLFITSRWIKYVSKWKSQVILDYFGGISADIVKPKLWQNITWLHIAAGEGNIELAKIFLTKGLKINCQNELGNTPLNAAINGGEEDMALWLLSAGASVFVSEKREILGLAMKCSHTVLQLVIESLDRDIENGTSLFCDFLLECGVSQADTLRFMKDSALHLAAARDDPQAILVLVEHGADLFWRDCYEYCVLWVALRNDSTSVIRLLLDRNAVPPRFDDIVISALDTASLWPEQLSVQIMLLDSILESGCDIDLIPNPFEYETILHYFASEMCPTTVKYLLKKGADIHRVTPDGVSALHIAAMNHEDLPDESELICKMLIDAIAADNDRVFDHTLPSGEEYGGGTTLHIAAEQEAYETVCLLLTSGIDTETRNDAGKTALDIAIELENEDIIKVLSNTTLASE